MGVAPWGVGLWGLVHGGGGGLAQHNICAKFLTKITHRTNVVLKVLFNLSSFRLFPSVWKLVEEERVRDKDGDSRLPAFCG